MKNSSGSSPLDREALEAALLYRAALVVARQRGLIPAETVPDALRLIRSDPANLLGLAGKPPDPWQAALLRAAARTQTILLCSRQSGKSTVASALALRAALLTDNSLVLLLSPTLRQSGELYRDKVLRLYNALGRPVGTVQESALQMTLANGSRVVSLPGDEETVRGYSGVTLLVIDEAARVPDDLYFSVRPMLAVSGGQLVVLSTPFGKRGFFHREWHGGGAWERVLVTAAQCPRIPADFLDEERRQMGEVWFNQEYLCEFTDAVGAPLFPAEWLERAALLAAGLKGKERKAEAIGIDPAEGGDKTALAAVDRLGLIELVSRKTPDTSVITGEALAFMRKHGVPAERVVFDRGGGGKEHADRLRAQGYPVRTVAFGEAVSLEPRRMAYQPRDRIESNEERYAYRNRRAALYGDLRQLLDPAANPAGFALPAEYVELRRQLSPIPLQYDPEGRLELPPKNKRNADDGKVTLVDLIGHSPDEADAVVLACHGMLHAQSRPRVGAR